MVTAPSAPARFQQTDLLSIQDLSPYDVQEIFDTTRMIKSRPEMYRSALVGKQFVLMFEKPSLRTRVTFEVGINRLGGYAMFMESPGGIEAREKIADVAKNLERWVDGVILRTFQHSTVTGMAANAAIPVINALTDREHPCQALADYFTLQEKFDDLKKIKLAFVGDGNNVAHSLMFVGAQLGAHVVIGCPPGFEPKGDALEWARARAKQTGGSCTVTHDPVQAAEGADALYTDVWASMGQEKEAESRKQVFRPYQVNGALFAHAKPDAVFLHCLPAHRGEEVTDEVIDSPRSVVFQEAENRLHAQKAVLHELMRSAVGAKA
jgi:ornithine carbamoyltransferase